MSRNPFFCILPFIHLHVEPEGMVRMCCAVAANNQSVRQSCPKLIAALAACGIPWGNGRRFTTSPGDVPQDGRAAAPA
jgi:hypothetical protein